MKQIEYYIESNKKLMEEKMKELCDNPTLSDEDKEDLQRWITIYKYYIKGLEDAKKYIEEER